MTKLRELDLESTLFPQGVPNNESGQLSIILEQYKIFVETSEKLVSRRQTVNTFFFSINTLSMSALGLAIGLMGKNAIKIELVTVGIIVVSVAGCFICHAWRTLIHSYNQLNTGKFKIIHLIEKHLPMALFAAEWHALDEGENPEIYKASTNSEKIVPIIFMLLYGILGLGFVVSSVCQVLYP